jgi:uncharacterized membrane protein
MNLPMILLVTIITFTVGILFAYYSHCDPVVSKRINSYNQIFSLFKIDILGNYPGIPGLFIAGLFSASLR